MRACRSASVSGTSRAGRNQLYERFYLASGARNYQIAHLMSPKERAFRLVDQALGLSRSPEGGDDAHKQALNLPQSGWEAVRK